MHPDERVRIETPEQVALELPIAGIGSRFLAVAIDTLLQIALAIGTVLALGYGARMLPDAVPRFFTLLGPAAAILVLFCIYWGYFAFFEIIWSGRTPGKRLAHVRVVKESGRAMTAYDAIARNVLRAVDFLPVMYGVGVLVMMLNRQSRRIGDYVAGTIVVRAQVPPADVSVFTNRLAGYYVRHFEGSWEDARWAIPHIGAIRTVLGLEATGGS